jgi:hypothetical protein
MITFSHRSSSKRVLSNCASILGLMRDDLDFTSRGDDLHPVTRSTRRCRTHSHCSRSHSARALPCSLQLLLSPRPSNSNDLPTKTHLTSTTPRTPPFLSLKVNISIKEKNLQNGACRRRFRLRLGRRLERRRERGSEQEADLEAGFYCSSFSPLFEWC